MREIIEEHLTLSTAGAAKRTEVNRQMLHDTLRGKYRVPPDMALRFAKLAGAEPMLYLEMQTKLDLWHARRRFAGVLDKIEPTSTVFPDCPRRRIGIGTRLGFMVPSCS
jgi:antitoxin HigA-1